MVSLEFANVIETMDLTKEEIEDLILEELFTRKSSQNILNQK